MTHHSISIFFSFFLFLFSGLGNLCIAETNASFSPFVDKTGKISLPQDFRKTMTHLGSWFVPKGEASGFHDVYSRSSDVSTYRKSGEFPDGAVLIKELRASRTADYTTGENVSHATTSVKQWFVMIKDHKNRFPNNKNWGNGWGWALIKPNNIKVNASLDFKQDCLGCHLPAKDNDYVYIEGYPTLKR